MTMRATFPLRGASRWDRQVSPEESKSDSDSSFVGDSLAEAAEMAANRTGRGEGRRYHTRQVTREAQWQRAAAAAEDDGENYYVHPSRLASLATGVWII